MRTCSSALANSISSIVTTVHGFSSPAILPAYQRSRSAFVSISFADRAPGVSYVANVYHGVDIAELPFDPAGGEALVYFGRIEIKGNTKTRDKVIRREMEIEERALP